MSRNGLLAEQFEASRAHLKAVAYRMLGTLDEAEDAVQECWLRLSRADTSGVENLQGWLTTVLARICLNMLRSRRSRREQALEKGRVNPIAVDEKRSDPERETILAESVGLALLVVLEKLTPVERVAFVLHDVFGVAFEDIAPVVRRSLAATRQLASRARRRVRGKGSPSAAANYQDCQVVEAFLTALRLGFVEGQNLTCGRRCADFL